MYGEVDHVDQCYNNDKSRLSQANKPKSASIYNSPGTDKIGTANPWQEVNVNPRQIFLSNKPCSKCETEMLYLPTRSE